MTHLATLPEGSYFEAPWRKEGQRFGHLQHVGDASCRVRIPYEDGWDVTQWSSGTEVLPATQDQFLRQGNTGTSDGSPRQHSAIENPVQIVHALCDEMEGSPRDTIIAACVERGVNINTAKTQYYAWRKKYGR